MRVHHGSSGGSSIQGGEGSGGGSGEDPTFQGGGQPQPSSDGGDDYHKAILDKTRMLSKRSLLESTFSPECRQDKAILDGPFTTYSAPPLPAASTLAIHSFILWTL